MGLGWEAYPIGDRQGLSRREIGIAAIAEAESSVASGF